MELRFANCGDLRATGPRSIEGYAAVFDQTADLGSYREVIRHGAFARCLREKQDVRCLFNHDANNILGRTSAGTLNLAEDTTGLHFKCTLPDTRWGKDLRTLVRRGDVDGCSVSFTCLKDNWTQETKGGDSRNLRELLDLNLSDVGPVTYPAYTETSVSARAEERGIILQPLSIGTYRGISNDIERERLSLMLRLAVHI